MPELAHLPSHDLIKVGERMALIGGFCTHDKYSDAKYIHYGAGMCILMGQPSAGCA